MEVTFLKEACLLIIFAVPSWSSVFKDLLFFRMLHTVWLDILVLVHCIYTPSVIHRFAVETVEYYV